MKPNPIKFTNFNSASKILQQHQDIDGLRLRIVNLINHKPSTVDYKIANRLLATWGIGKETPFSLEEKNSLLNSMRFGKGSKNTKYGDRRWNPEAREESLKADYGIEEKLPKNVQLFIQFFQKNNLTCNFHRKPITRGCKEVSKTRINSYTGSRGVSLESEIKTILFKTIDLSTNKEIYISFHTKGHLYINTKATQNILNTQNLSHIKLPNFDNKYRLNHNFLKKFKLGPGRLNPLSLHTSSIQQDILLIQVIDSILIENPTLPGYTNTGQNTWGVEIFDVPSFMKCLTSQSVTSNNKLNYPTTIIAPFSSHKI